MARAVPIRANATIAPPIAAATKGLMHAWCNTLWYDVMNSIILTDNKCFSILGIQWTTDPYEKAIQGDLERKATHPQEGKAGCRRW